MNIEQINETDNLQKIKDFLETDSFEISNAEGIYILNDVVVLQIIVNVSFKTHDTYEETIEGKTKNKEVPTSVSIKKADNTEIGTIFFSDNARHFDKGNMSKDKYMAYLVDVTQETFHLETYFLTKDYLVLKKEYFQEYKSTYKSSSVLWGGFYHIEDQKTKRPLLQSKEEIKCLPNIKLPTEYHIDNAQRAIIQPYAFERFLKNYHLLELLFDYQIIQDIAENKDNIKVAGEILNKSYKDSGELYRLTYIIEKKNTDINKVINCLNKIINYKNLAIDIFYEYGKDSNPLKKIDEFNEILLKDTLFSKDSFLKRDTQGNIITPHKQQFIQVEHEKFICKLAAYWIYRIRSSIAHSKIGEFLLISSEEEHEKFIIEFAEPLLQEVLIQCFES